MKYIVFDMDETLLNNMGEITPFTLQVLKQLQAMGHKIVMNTARSQYYAQAFINTLCPDYSILNGGALILDKNQSTCFQATISPETTQKVISCLIPLSKTFSIQTYHALYTNDLEYYSQGAQYFNFADEPFPHSAFKIVASIADSSRVLEIAQRFDLEYTAYFGGPFRRYSHKQATKALGNRNLVRLLGGSMDDVIAFGDDNGDITMLQDAGIGVLMKNAKPELYGQCQAISEYTNNEDGVARFLQSYFNLR